MILSGVLSLVLLIILEIVVRSKDLIIEDHELINEIGVLSRKKIVIHYSNITDFPLINHFIQRIFGIGDVHINTGGTDQRELTLNNFSDINEIHDLISQKIRRFRYHTQ